MIGRLKDEAIRLAKQVVQRVGRRVDQKRMHWIRTRVGSERHTFLRCSHCQGCFSIEAAFCPNCGKPMDIGIDEGIYANDVEGYA